MSTRALAGATAIEEASTEGDGRAIVDTGTHAPARLIPPLDTARLAREFRAGTPFPHVLIEGLLDPELAAEVASAYPDFERAARMGRMFEALNEHRKIQVTDARVFPEPVQRLNRALAAPQFIADLEAITGIEGLLYDEELAGGGMHITGARGRLDVHVDFNHLEERGLYRRLNLLLYLNPTWDPAWGGALELWDAKVRTMHHTFAPRLNRAVIFETSEHSYHGVAPVTCPPDVVRKSFAVYYYTREAPPGYAGKAHTTLFKARPHERLRKYVLMPLARVRELARDARRTLRDRLRGDP